MAEHLHTFTEKCMEVDMCLAPKIAAQAFFAIGVTLVSRRTDVDR